MTDLQRIERLERRIAGAMGIIEQHAYIDGAHHKQWVLDQVIRQLKEKDYDQWAKTYEYLSGGEWDKGIAP